MLLFLSLLKILYWEKINKLLVNCESKTKVSSLHHFSVVIFKHFMIILVKELAYILCFLNCACQTLSFKDLKNFNFKNFSHVSFIPLYDEIMRCKTTNITGYLWNGKIPITSAANLLMYNVWKYVCYGLQFG